MIKEARYFRTLSDQRVHCTLCPHDCRIPNGSRGACGVRVNLVGNLYTLVYDKVVARGIEPIEKKPLFHFHPGSKAFSIGTVGCNLRCAFCQNWQISQWPHANLPKKLEWPHDDEPGDVLCPQLARLEQDIPGEHVTPKEIVEATLQCGASSIAYTYTDPTIFFELAYETAVLARDAGLKNVFVTSGYISEPPLRQIAAVLDAVNVDLKFFRDESYRRISRVRLEPILNAIRLYHSLGVWVEVTTMIIPGVNDSDDELADIAQFIFAIAPSVPWHISQFYPAYKMLDASHTPIETLHRARQIGIDAGLKYVYEGNVPGYGNENTYCPGCGGLVIERHGFCILSNRIRGGRCPDCRSVIDGINMDATESVAEVSGKFSSTGSHHV